MSGVTSLGGVFVRSSDPHRLRTFYRTVLGFSVGSWGSATFPMAERTASGGLRPGYQIWGPIGPQSPFLRPSTRDLMITLRVDDLGEVVKRARRLGAHVLDRSGSRPQGRFAYLIDPEGTLLELWEPDPDDPALPSLGPAGLDAASLDPAGLDTSVAAGAVDLRDGDARPAVAHNRRTESISLHLPRDGATTAPVAAPAPAADPPRVSEPAPVPLAGSAPGRTAAGRAPVPVSVVALRTAGATVGTLRREIVTPLDRRTVWRCWTEPELVAAWWRAARARVDLRIGGRYELEFLRDAPAGSRGTEGSQILSYVPGSMLSFSWNAPPHLSMRGILTWVSVTLEPVRGGTRVRVEHTGFGTGPHWVEYGHYLAGAWQRALHRFERFRPPETQSPPIQQATPTHTAPPMRGARPEAPAGAPALSAG